MITQSLRFHLVEIDLNIRTLRKCAVLNLILEVQQLVSQLGQVENSPWIVYSNKNRFYTFQILRVKKQRNCTMPILATYVWVVASKTWHVKSRENRLLQMKSIMPHFVALLLLDTLTSTSSFARRCTREKYCQKLAGIPCRRKALPPMNAGCIC